MKQFLLKYFPFLRNVKHYFVKKIYLLKMRFDTNNYASKFEEQLLPYLICDNTFSIINTENEFDIKYQYNKEENLKIAAKYFDHLMIYPQQVLSLLKQLSFVREKDYKDGLCIINGQMSTGRGGGLCQLSIDLFGTFLCTPLDVIERHGHDLEYFRTDGLQGLDATISEGYLDLKIKNNTDHTFQLVITFEEHQMNVKVYCNHEIKLHYELLNEGLYYEQDQEKVYQKVSVYRNIYDLETDSLLGKEFLYDNQCQVCYPLTEDEIKTVK